MGAGHGGRIWYKFKRVLSIILHSKYSYRWSQNAEDERDNESSKGRKDEACDCHVFDAEIAG